MSAPIPYAELSTVVERTILDGTQIPAFSVEPSAKMLPDQANFSPYATTETIGCRLSYQHTPSHTDVWANVEGRPKRWADLLPSFRTSYTVGDTQRTATVHLRDLSGSYTVAHPVFHIAADVKVADGLASRTAVTTRAAENATVGVEALYDPKRSGLKDLTLIASRTGCPNFDNGDVLLKYSLLDGLGLQLRVPVSPTLDAAVISENRRFILGAQSRCPFGSKVIGNVNFTEGNFTIGFMKNIQTAWKIAVSITTPLSGGSGLCPFGNPSIGIRFSSDLL